jgi:hypothetical protein
MPRLDPSATTNFTMRSRRYDVKTCIMHVILSLYNTETKLDRSEMLRSGRKSETLK